MTKPTKIVSSENRIKWVSMEDSWPPIGERVLTFHGDRECPLICADELWPGSDIHAQDPSLYYWLSGEDFIEITHWAKLPNLPDEAA